MVFDNLFELAEGLCPS